MFLYSARSIENIQSDCTRPWRPIDSSLYVSIGAKGSKMPRGDKEHMMRYPVAMPPKELLCVFSKLYSPMHNQIAKLYKENIHLANLRDWLLPLLMNGQATIDK